MRHRMLISFSKISKDMYLKLCTRSSRYFKTIKNKRHAREKLDINNTFGRNIYCDRTEKSLTFKLEITVVSQKESFVTSTMVSRFSHELGYYTFFFFFYYFAPPPLSPPFLYPSSPLRYTRTKRFSIFRQHVVVKNLITFPSFDDRFDDPLSCIDRRMNRDLSRTRV